MDFCTGGLSDDVQREGKTTVYILDFGVQNPVDTGIRHWSISSSKFRGFLMLFVPIAVIPSGI
jgi:hypothetical protein